MPRVALSDSLQLCRISGCLYTIRSRLTSLYNLFMRCSFQDHAGYPQILGIVDLRPLLRSARLQSLLEVGPARLLAAMLRRFGCLCTSFDQDHALVFLLFLEHQTSHAACFNARGLLYECVFDALLFSSPYRPVGKPVSHHVVTRPSFSSLPSFWTIIPSILPAMMLRYYS
jgi:hypothetical protein